MKNLLLCILLMNVLELYSQNTKNANIIDDKPKVAENKQNTSSNLVNKTYFIDGRQINPVNHHVLNINLPECNNYIALYNKATMRYDYYPTTYKINFNLNSPQVANQYLIPTKRDSFNPYGAHKPQIAIALGVVNLLLKKIQE